jgi:GLPGLI family protein
MYRKTSNQNIIYINYPENKTTLLGHPSGVSGKFEYTEDFEIPKWTIHKETQKILSHICKKASCSFKGRDYVAWYAIDIPISRGPYKFAGLPGLIMKIADTENLYSFECIAIEKCNQPMYKDKVDKVRFISKKEFFNMEKRSHDNYKAALVQMLKDQGTLNIDEFVNKLSIPEGAKIKYNPIELE